MTTRIKLLIGAIALLCVALLVVKLVVSSDSGYVPPGRPTTTTGAPVPDAALKKPHLQLHHRFPDGHSGPAYVAPDGTVVRVPN